MKINPGNARGLLVPQGDRPFSFVVYSSEIRDFGVQTSRRIAVDPAIVVIVAQSYAALPKFVLDKLARQQIVLRGLELLWRYDFHQQTGAFSLVRQLCV